MSGCVRCVLGQVIGGYEAVMENPAVIAAARDREIFSWAVLCGFDLPAMPVGMADKQFGKLRELWVTEILTRRATESRVGEAESAQARNAVAMSSESA